MRSEYIFVALLILELHPSAGENAAAPEKPLIPPNTGNVQNNVAKMEIPALPRQPTTAKTPSLTVKPPSVTVKPPVTVEKVIQPTLAKILSPDKQPLTATQLPPTTTIKSSTTIKLPTVLNVSNATQGVANATASSNSGTLKPKLPSRLIQKAQQELLDCLTTGEWRAESYTPAQEEEMKAFLRKTRSQYNMPVPLQRADGKCGNVTFGEGGLKWFRAVCDPDGPAPCCIDGMCQNKAEEQCVCEDCYDLRQRLNAELSTWKNNDPQCQVKDYPTGDACAVMEGSEIHFIGDSHTRHTYMGLQIVLTGNAESGCMGSDLPPEFKTECRGLYMFTEKICRERVMSDHVVCGGRVHLNLHELHSSVYADRIVKVVSELIGKPGTVVIIGLGHHDSFSPQTVIPKVASPVLDLLEKSGKNWPKIIFLGVHSLGLLKTPEVPQHMNPNVLVYNSAMRNFLQSHQVNFVDTFSLTKRISSPDGSHYGKGANLLKARVLLEFIRRVGNVTSIADHLFTNSTILM